MTMRAPPTMPETRRRSHAGRYRADGEAGEPAEADAGGTSTGKSDGAPTSNGNAAAMIMPTGSPPRKARLAGYGAGKGRQARKLRRGVLSWHKPRAARKTLLFKVLQTAKNAV